jgi:TctA family transporter
MIPYKYLYPSAMFFVCIGVYSTNNDMFQVGEVLVIGIAGYILNMLGFHPAPVLLGFVLGPRFEENFRRALLISRGDLLVFLQRPISAVFVTLCVLLILGQIYVRLRKPKANGDSLVPAELLAAAQSPHPGAAHAPQGMPAPQPAAE